MRLLGCFSNTLVFSSDTNNNVSSVFVDFLANCIRLRNSSLVLLRLESTDCLFNIEGKLVAFIVLLVLVFVIPAIPFSSGFDEEEVVWGVLVVRLYRCFLIAGIGIVGLLLLGGFPILFTLLLTLRLLFTLVLLLFILLGLLSLLFTELSSFDFDESDCGDVLLEPF